MSKKIVGQTDELLQREIRRIAIHYYNEGYKQAFEEVFEAYYKFKQDTTKFNRWLKAKLKELRK